jgi:hypothetical protein
MMNDLVVSKRSANALDHNEPVKISTIRCSLQVTSDTEAKPRCEIRVIGASIPKMEMRFATELSFIPVLG